MSIDQRTSGTTLPAGDPHADRRPRNLDDRSAHGQGNRIDLPRWIDGDGSVGPGPSQRRFLPTHIPRFVCVPPFSSVQTKGTFSFGRRHQHTHTLCVRCGRRSFHIQQARCSSCAFPAKKMRRCQ